MKKIYSLIILSVLGLVAVGQIAQAQVLNQAPVTSDKTRLAVSPYVQAAPSNTYSFLAVTHPSLDTAAASIGIAVEVLGMTTVPNDAVGRATVFTINAGETHRIFVVNNAHPTINTSNAAFQGARTHIIKTADSAQFGNVRIVAVSSNPNTAPKSGLSQLSFWGVMVAESSSTGFALEFIGDAQDSITAVGASRGIN